MRSWFQRWAWRAGLCLALGLLTTVAVAWGLAAWLPHAGLWSARRYDARPSSSPIRAIDTWECGRTGMLRRQWLAEVWGATYYHGRPPTSRSAPEGYVPESGPLWGAPPSPDPWAPSATSYGCEDARGWPALAMWCEFKQVKKGGGWVWQASRGLLISPSDDRQLLNVRVLPARPLWPGLIANTSVYAVGWAGLLVILDWRRHVWRRARGRCVGCGYELRGLTPGAACPECGALGQ